MRLALRDKSAETLDQERLKWLRTFAEERLKTDLEAVEGTEAVKISGGLEDEIQITVDQDRLAALDLTIEAIASRLRAENVNLSGGELQQGSQRFLVRTLNEFTSVDEIANAIIATPLSPTRHQGLSTCHRRNRYAACAVTAINASSVVVFSQRKFGCRAKSANVSLHFSNHPITGQVKLPKP